MRRSYYGFRPYVPVAKRRAQATRELARLSKKGQSLSPVVVEGRRIAHSFWGIAWCDNLESYSDFDNRLPRGRTYVRNGSVVHLEIGRGKILARVSGSSLYTVNIEIDPLAENRWQVIRKQSAGKVGTLVELLQGRLSKAIMELVTDKQTGLFPNPKEIKIGCNCPDYAWLCKHAAAVLYGIGSRLDSTPEMLFTLRGVDHAELIDQAAASLPDAANAPPAPTLTGDLSALFGIEISEGAGEEEKQTSVKKRAKNTGKKTGAKVSKTAKTPPKPGKKSIPQQKKAVRQSTQVAKGKPTEKRKTQPTPAKPAAKRSKKR